MITAIDFNCIGQLAQHCDNQKLCIAISESKDFDLTELFCEDIILEALQNYTATSGFWFYLWNGSEFESTCGNKKKHFGLKRVWVYYAYSRYIMLNGYNDTATGFKQKTNDYSLPTPISELQYFANKHKDMGLSAYKKTLSFICLNKGEFANDINIDCSEQCDCNSAKCGGKTITKTGFSSKIISKK